MLCCVCVLETPKMLGIFDEEGVNLNIANIIDKHFWFKTQPDDALTSHICTICWGKIKDFHEFYNNAEKVHKSFQKCQHIQIKKEDIKQENVHEKYFFVDNLPQAELGFKKVAETEETTLEKNPLETEELHLHVAKENVRNLRDSLSDDISNEDLTVKIGVTKQEEKKTKTKRKDPNALEENDSTKKKRNSFLLDPIVTEQLVKKHILMLCDLCVFFGNTFSDIVAHFKEHHTQVKPYIMCCDRKFLRNYSVEQHALYHENPDSFRCNDCNRSFTTINGLKAHNLNHHSPEEKRMHACEFCPRRFGIRHLLEIHKQTHIPKEEWTITCTKCTKRTVKFVSQYLLNKHNSMFHKREANICHVCAKEIKRKNEFEKHIRSHFEDSGPRVKCSYPNCERWLKDKDNLRTHMQTHNLAGKAHICPECGKQYPNGRALTSHKRCVHSRNTFRCEACGKTFKKAISLKEHMPKHTGETLYKCPFCIKTFNSSANMHAHKKKQHFNEWQELKRKNSGPFPK